MTFLASGAWNHCFAFGLISVQTSYAFLMKQGLSGAGLPSTSTFELRKFGISLMYEDDDDGSSFSSSFLPRPCPPISIHCNTRRTSS